jgi:hypothetical protein
MADPLDPQRRAGRQLGFRVGRGGLQADTAVHLPVGGLRSGCSPTSPSLVVGDPIAGLVIAAGRYREGRASWHGDSCCAVSARAMSQGDSDHCSHRLRDPLRLLRL